ncbi:MAG TPA: hypothetical protein VI754_08170 [Bacteriovoracaceae bacterium]|nr:hypothetical protein [Bacteriovoracaceae bacterium]
MLAIKFIFIFSLLAMPPVALGIVCPPGTYLVSGHPRSEYFRNDGTHVDAATVSSYCKNYRTDGPFKTVFADKMPRGWPHKKEEFRKCTAKEQKNISEILKSIPSVLTQVGEVTILCAKKSEYENNPATSIPETKTIVLYGSVAKSETKRVLIHELAHFLYESLSQEERRSYWRASEWFQVNINQPPISIRPYFSEEDGARGADEDFSNNVEHYFEEHEKFKKDFKDIYLWLKKFFGGNK